MTDKKTYLWLVQKGKIEISEKFPNISIELDYQNNDFCELDKQDVLEIRNILFTLSSDIWNSMSPSDQPAKPLPSFQQISNSSFQWIFEDSTFSVIYDFSNLALQLQHEKSNKFLFPVTSIVQLIQILDHYLDNLER